MAISAADKNQRLQQVAGGAGKQKKSLADRQQKARDELGQLGVDPSLTGTLKHPGKFLQNLRGGKGPPWERLQLLQAASGRYQGPQQKLTKEQEDALAAGAPVDFKEQEDQMLGQLQDYVTARLGVGLTPEEKQTMRGELRAPVESSFEQANRDIGTGEAQAGIDPRSGVGQSKAMQLERMRQQGLSGVENAIVDADLQRKREIEQEAAGVAAGEEGKRQFDVNAQLQRLAQVEAGMAGLSNLGETQREYDVGETETARQAQLSRDQFAKYARSLVPSGLEKWASGIGGLFQGLGV